MVAEYIIDSLHHNMQELLSIRKQLQGFFQVTALKRKISNFSKCILDLAKKRNKTGTCSWKTVALCASVYLTHGTLNNFVCYQIGASLFNEYTWISLRVVDSEQIFLLLFSVSCHFYVQIILAPFGKVNVEEQFHRQSKPFILR